MYELMWDLLKVILKSVSWCEIYWKLNWNMLVTVRFIKSYNQICELIRDLLKVVIKSVSWCEI